MKTPTSETVKAWKVTFDNAGSLTVFALDAVQAMKAAEEKAQSHGWNLRAVQAVEAK